MTRRLVALLVVAASCGGNTYTGPYTRRRVRPPVLDGSQLRISVMRELGRTYDTDCGIIGRLLGVGETECVGVSSEATGLEQVGVVVVDLVAGGCAFVPSHSPPRYEGELMRHAIGYPPRVDARVRYDGHSFVATTDHVIELDAAGRSVAIHRQPAALRPEAYASPWLEPRRWPVGVTHHGRTLTRTEHGLALIHDERGAIQLGPDAKTVYLLGDTTLAATEGRLVDVEVGWRAGDSFQPIPGVPRAARYVGDRWLVEAGGRYWSVEPTFGTMSPIGFDMTPIGTAGTSLVLHRLEHGAILLFDAATRAWRDLRYRGCIPAEPPVPGA